MMDHFVQGVLTVDEDVYILDPDIRLVSGEKIHILYSDLRPRAERQKGDDDPLSLLLEADQWYELLLIIRIRKSSKITYAASIPSSTSLKLVSQAIKSDFGSIHVNNVVQGIILDPNWNPASVQYLASAEYVLKTYRLVLVETAIGKVVLNYKSLQEGLGEQAAELAPGGYLEWEPGRLDLLAIIEKRAPRPGE